MATIKNQLMLFSIFCIGGFSACDKKEVKPSQEYYAVLKLSMDPGFPLQHEQDSILYKGIILKVGTLPIKSYGVCYGFKENPNFNDFVSYSKSKMDTIPFIFENKLKNLKIGTIYQARTFLITTKDTLFGVNNYFKTIGRNEWFTREKTPNSTAADSRADKIATFFDDNRLFMIYQNEHNVWEYDTRKYTWNERKAIPTLLKGKTTKYSFMVNGKAFCGNLLQTNEKLENEFWEFDDKANNWKKLTTTLPALNSDQNYGFTDGSFGYVINVAADKVWHFWKFDPKNNNWQKISETPRNETIENVFSDGTSTYLQLSNNTIYKVENGEYKFFKSLNNLLDFNGKFGYYGGILNNRIILGEYYLNNLNAVKTRQSKSIDLITGQVESLVDTDFTKASGIMQTKNRLFFGAASIAANEKIRLYEYFTM